MKVEKVSKILLGVIATIFLGAIGSGVWERILSPSLREFGNFLTSTISSISKTYSDSIYLSASSIISYDQTKVIVLLFMLFVFTGLFIYALYSKKDNPIVCSIHRFLVKPMQGWMGIIYFGSFVMLILFFMAKDTTVRDIRWYSTKNMEIVRPYIGENQYLMLRSDFLSMGNKDDFENFLKKLYLTASTASIDIKKFESK